MDLIHVEPTKPRWEELASIHGIELNPINPTLPTPMWEARIENFGTIVAVVGDSPKEAVVRLIHRLKLNGWQEVTV